MKKYKQFPSRNCHLTPKHLRLTPYFTTIKVRYGMTLIIIIILIFLRLIYVARRIKDTIHRIMIFGTWTMHTSIMVYHIVSLYNPTKTIFKIMEYTSYSSVLVPKVTCPTVYYLRRLWFHLCPCFCLCLSVWLFVTLRNSGWRVLSVSKIMKSG